MHRVKIFLLAVVALVVGSANSVLAVLSADQLAVTSALDTLISDLATWGWTAILAVVTFVIGVKLFKKFVSRAT